MESAQAHQKLAQAQLEELSAHTQGLDAVVRDEIRRAMVDELKSVTAEVDAAAVALRGLRRAAGARGLIWNAVLAFLGVAIPALVARYVLPSQAEVERLRHERDSLARNIESLEGHGGRAQWRSCGNPARLCVRIDRNAPAYGSGSDYFIVRGD
jgi:hypothetical protein